VAIESTVRLLTRDQAAVHLRITIDELDDLRRAGTGPEWGQWRRTIRYDIDELDAWMKRHQPGKNPSVVDTQQSVR
jgi:hypothetical protein